MFCSVRQRHRGTETQTHRDETRRHRDTETGRKGTESQVRKGKVWQGRARKGKEGNESKEGFRGIGARLLPHTACGMTPPNPPAFPQQKLPHTVRRVIPPSPPHPGMTRVRGLGNKNGLNACSGESESAKEKKDKPYKAGLVCKNTSGPGVGFPIWMSAGFCPGRYQNQFVGQPMAGRRPEFNVFAIRIRPKIGPDARLPARRCSCMT